MTPLFILIAILVFGVLIAVHEFGHFVAAKWCGVKVNEFSIGMGPLVWHRQGAETLYSLRAFPVGGYCAMEGEDEDTGSERSFVRQKAWKKLIILVAGVTMNFLTGLLLLLILYAGANTYYTDEIVGFAPEFALEGEDGLMVGDVFYKVDGYRAYQYGDAALFLSFHRGDTIDLVMLRDGEKVTLNDFPMTRQLYTDAEGGGTYTGFGIYRGYHAEPITALGRFRYVWINALELVQSVRFSLVQLFTGGASIQDLSGPVGIVSTMTQVGEQSRSIREAAANMLYFAAFLAVNLAVMNLLPLPALDGGRIFFLLIDGVWLALFKKTVPEKFQAAYNAVGFAALMGLMLLVTAQDIWKLVK